MKKRALSLLLALVLILSLTPAALAYDGQASQIDRVPAPAQQTSTLTKSAPASTGWAEPVPYPEQVPTPETRSLYGAVIDEDEVYQILNSFRSVYPEGMYWTNESQQYMLSVSIYDERDGSNVFWIGHGCVAFCYRLSDAAFGDLSARNVYNFTYDDVRTGDILRLNDGTLREHSVTVLKKYSDHVVLAEANYNSSVHWDRTMTRDEVMAADYITTRYPSGSSSDIPPDTSPVPVSAPSNMRVSTDKSSYSLGETVTMYFSANDAMSFNVSLWQGNYGAGTLAASGAGFTSNSATYQPKAAGTYTLYVEAVNNYGTTSATCQFTVSGGGPSDLKLTADRSVFVVGEPFFISVTATNMTGFNAELWRGEYGAGTRTAYESNYSPYESIKVTLASTEHYTIYVEAYNDYGKTSATLSVSAVANTNNVTFTDVPSMAYYADAVSWAIDNGITNGTSATTFSPDDTVTRAQAVTFLWRAMGEPSPSRRGSAFKDISSSAFYYKAVLWAAENGITKGVSATEFFPGGNVTRGQLITFLWRTLKQPGRTGQGAWYADAERWAYSNSLVAGTAHSYTTNANCPRSDVVYYMWKALA